MLERVPADCRASKGVDLVVKSLAHLGDCVKRESRSNIHLPRVLWFEHCCECRQQHKRKKLAQGEKAKVIKGSVPDVGRREHDENWNEGNGP